MSNDSNVQGFYKGGVDHASSTNAGEWQKQNNPSHTPAQQHNESHEAYTTRVNSQKSGK